MSETELKNAAEDVKTDPPLPETDRPEQWKSGGDCGKCRREKYCGTPCKENRKRKEMIAKRDALKIMIEALNRGESGDAEKDAEAFVTGMTVGEPAESVGMETVANQAGMEPLDFTERLKNAMAEAECDDTE